MEHFKIETDKNRIELLDQRFYECDGKFYPSVTTILDAYPKGSAFYEWLKVAGEKADDIRDEFGKRGSVVHNLTEQYDKGVEVSLMDEQGRAKYSSIEWAMFERYVEFIDRFKPEMLLIEAHYCIPELGFGGTLDRVVRIKDKIVLLDIKTSNYLHNHFWLQMAAYEKLYNYQNLLGDAVKIDEIAILWLNAKTRTEGKDNTIQGKGWQLKFPEKSINEYYKLFSATHALWKEEFGTMKPRNIFYNLTHKKNGN